MKKAEITVYLAMILTVLISLILTLIEGARINAMRMQIECVMDMGLNSCFAEYNRELLDQYDLLFVDTAYGTGEPSIDNMEIHLLNYIEYNYHPITELISISQKDWLSLQVEDVAIEETSIATDERGKVCKRQAINYVKNKISMDLVNEIQKQSDIMKNNRLESRNIDAECSEIENKLNKLEKIENGKKKKVRIKSPADSVNNSKSIGILGLLIDDAKSVSLQSVNLYDYASHRNIKIGTGITKRCEVPDSILSEILFGEYLLEKCGDYTKQKDKSLLKYQLEYILYGTNNDKENLKLSAKKLALIRQISNTLYLWSDIAKVNEVDAAATIIASAVFMPEIQPIVKASLIFAWAYAESIGDLRVLLDGGKIPLMKNAGDWKLQFSQLNNYTEHFPNSNSNAKGLTYRDYMRLLLLSMNKNEKLDRFMDLIEMDLRQTEGNKKFFLDGCVDGIVAIVESKSKFGYSYSISRSYFYEL